MFGAPKQPLIATASNSGGSGGITAALSTKLGLANRAAPTSSSTAKEAGGGSEAAPPRQPPPQPPPPPLPHRASAAGQKTLLASSPSPSNEPQDLSMSGSVDLSLPSSSSSKTPSFTSPKKAFMMRDAAIRESERAGEG